MTIARIGATSALIAALLVAPAGMSLAQPAPPSPAAAPAAAVTLAAALDDGDIFAVRRLAEDARMHAAERALARAALAYWSRLDAQAGDALARATTDRALSPDLRRCAWTLLSGLRLRQGRYAQAVVAIDAALPGITEEGLRTDLEQSRGFAAALAHVSPMTVSAPARGAMRLTRDRATLSRAPLTINGGAIDAIVDTGSGVSAISESNARRLGLRMLDAQVSVGTATSASATTRLAVADRLTFAGAEYRNVVFLVLPDSALTFANGAYVVPAIIGLPLLVPLGRIEYRNQSGGELVSYSRSGSRPGADANLMLDGVEAFTFARLEGQARLVRLFIDTGANTSHLNRRFATDFPAVMAQAIRQSVTRSGGAGSETQDAQSLPTLTLLFGQDRATITEVDVIDDHHGNRHGDIGLDALRTGPGYVLDFEVMRFDLIIGG